MVDGRGGDAGRAARGLRVWDKTLKVWDLETRPAAAHAGGPLGCCQWRGGDAGRAARGLRVLGQDAEGVGPGERPQALRTLEGHSDCVDGVAVTPDGRRAVSASSDKTLKVWDLESGAELRTLEGHSDEVSGVAVTPDGRRVVSVSDDKTLKVWDIDSGRCLHSLYGTGPFLSCFHFRCHLRGGRHWQRLDS